MSATKIRSLLASGLLFGALAFPGTALAAEPYGVWLRPSTGAQVRFYNCGGKLCGKVVAVKDQSRKSEVGKSIMHGAVKSGANTWKGKLTDLATGSVYSGTVTVQGANALDLQGCVALILCKSETWKRVK
jgi:uncharacterized protein (DUF2147 family)